MNKSFEQEVALVGLDLRRMAARAEDAVRAGIAAVRDRDRAAAEAVAVGEDAIDQLENAVVARCHRILALHQPVCRDLRRVLACLQVATEVERVGDLARGVAERGLRLLDFPPAEVPPRLRRMADRVIGMVHDGLDAFLIGAAGQARDVLARDEEVDDDHAAIIGELIDRMKRSADEVEPGLSLFGVVRHLERIADHATNVAEHAVFLAEGEVLRHRHLVAAASA